MQTIFDKILPFKTRSACASISVLGCLMLSFCLGSQAYAQQATSIAGQIILSNQEVVADASVYVADVTANSLLEPNHKHLLSRRLNSNGLGQSKSTMDSNDAIKNTSNCSKPPIAVLSFACSDETGHFNLALPSVPSLPLVVTIAKNGKTMNITLDLDDLGEDIGQIALDASQITEKLDRIAIVEHVTPYVKSRLAGKVGDLQNNAEVTMDSEFLLGYGLDVIQSNVEYPGFAVLFSDFDRDGRLDIFNYSTVLLKTSWKTVLSQVDAKKRQVLLDYVEQGGQLLITNKRQPKLINIEGFI